jgi:HD-like signal output (HDOD) protein
MNDQVIATLEKIHNLPTIPAVIQKLRVTITHPHADAAKVSAIIENDPAMMTRILKIVNSAFYGGVEPITSVQHAVARMGFVAISNIAMSTFVFSSFGSSDKDVFDRQAFWRHCITTGIAEEIVYTACRNKVSQRFGKDILHLTGLLHDIGKIVFEQHFHNQFAEAIESARVNKLALNLAEQEALGADHCEVGAWLAEKWRIDEQVQQVTRWHHDPEKADPKHYDLVALCHVANYICNVCNFGESGDSTRPTASPAAWRHLGIGESDISRLAELAQHETDKADTMLALL